MIILIINHFSISAKLCEFPWKYQNSTARLEIPRPVENFGP